MNILLKFVGVIGLAVALSALLSLPVWLLWNIALVGAINGVNEISWMQAWGISLLCAFLFKSSVTSQTNS